jgi:fructose/tagatose bisphosphate aldolase
MSNPNVDELLKVVGESFRFIDHKVSIVDETKFRNNVHQLAEISALAGGVKAGWARYIIRLAANELGIYPASIQDLYLARGAGKTPQTFTVPAVNLRVLAFDCARAVFRAARKLNAGAIIFEIARSEMNYTDQRPAEYSASILAAAIAEGHKGPVFVQGDHFQVSAKKYSVDSQAEIDALKKLMMEASAAGFFNIDVDTSTLVDITKSTVPEQQVLNASLSAMFTAYIRSIQPEDVVISVGGEIGEVGGKNSTEEELRAYLDGFRKDLDKTSKGAAGLSKISIQTGTSHGGVVLPDGSIAQVSVDFETLKHLSQVSRRDYGLGGAVQHGASTLPEDAFGKFVEYEGCEVHLATNFMNIFFDKVPATFREEMYAWLRDTQSAERKPGMTDEQFYYKTRKNAVGQFKKQSWLLGQKEKATIQDAWEGQFTRLFNQLGLKDTQKLVNQFIKHPVILPDIKDYLGEDAAKEDVSGLAD